LPARRRRRGDGDAHRPPCALHLRPVREGRLNFVQGQIVIVAALQIAAVVKLFVH
jgi:hypothetical protein